MSGPDREVPLFCLPYAGGNTAMFYRWVPQMPPGIRLRPVELPGHGTRHDEEPVGVMHRLVRRLADEVRPQITGPYAVLGHSFGALLAFELARALRRSVGEPCELIVSGRNGPWTPISRPFPPVHELTDDELVEAAGAWGGLPRELDQHPTLRARLLRVLRVDLFLAQNYLPIGDERLTCPVSVYAGHADPLVDRAGLGTWRRETTGPTRVVRVRGGHLIVHDRGFVRDLRGHLERLVARVRPEPAGSPAMVREDPLVAAGTGVRPAGVIAGPLQ
jgi:surfactin synthase thioesterase subunit